MNNQEILLIIKDVSVKCSPGDFQLHLYFVFGFLQTMQTQLIGFCSFYKDTGLEAYVFILKKESAELSRVLLCYKKR